MITSQTINFFCKIWFFQILINFVIFFPIIFNFYIIPKIENRVGEKLVHRNPMYRLQVFSSWFGPPLEVGLAICIDYVVLKLTGKNRAAVAKRKSLNALRQIRYDVRHASLIEVFMGCVVGFELLTFFLMVIGYWISILFV